MSALTVFLVVVAALFALACVVAVLLAVWAARHAARAGRAVGRQARVGRAVVHAKLPGPAQEVHVQRARVERELVATRAAWTEARHLDRRGVRPLAAHRPVLEATGRRLALDLSIVAAEPDDWRRRAWLAEVRPVVDTYVRACGHFRQSVLLAGDAYGDGTFARTAAALADLAAAEHERVVGYRDIGVVDAAVLRPVSLAKTPLR